MPSVQVTPTMKLIPYTSGCTLGCDPEFFIEDNKGRIVGAEKTLPSYGLQAEYGGKIIIDGVQAELNPPASTCRGTMGAYMKSCLSTLEKTLKAKGMKVCTSGTVHLDEEELKSLAKENQRLGCGPSNNLYSTRAKVTVNKKNKLIRSAGGHIHLGIKNPEPEVIVPILDLLVGNTCVLIDRDPNQAIRRKQYGRAGEYRLPQHGLEYRTPSNFWLRSYQLMGLVMGLCRLAHKVCEKEQMYNPATCSYDKDGKAMYPEAIKWLQENINPKAVRVAINKNDFDLAMKNWETTKEFVCKFLLDSPSAQSSYALPLYPSGLAAFEYFVDKGIDYWFPEKDIFAHWKKLDAGGSNSFRSHGENWEGFFAAKVLPEWQEQQAKKK